MSVDESTGSPAAATTPSDPPRRVPGGVPAHRPLASNASWRFAATLVRAVIGVLSVPVYTRVLGMSQWGLLALFQAATAPLLLLDLGVGTATVKYVAESIAREDRDGAARVVQTTLLFNLAMGAIGVGTLVVAAPWLARSVFAIPPADVGAAIAGFRVVALAWIAGVVLSTYGAVLAGHQRYDATSRLSTVTGVASTGAGLLAAAATRDVVVVVLAQAGVMVVMSYVYFRTAARLLPQLARVPRFDRAAFHRSFSFGAWQAVGTAGGLLSGWADRYILGAFFAPVVVGFYAIVQTIYIQLYTAFTEMGEVLFPAVSHREGVGDLAGARRLSLLVGWTLSSGFGICAAVVAAVGGDFLHLWISAEAARQATTTLRMLCVGGIFAIVAIAPFYYLLGIGKTRWHAASATFVGGTITAVGLVLIPRYGLLGVGLGLMAGALVRWGFVALIWREHFARDVGIWEFAAHLWAPPIASAALLVAASRVHDAISRAPSWGWLVVETALSFGVVAAIQIGVGEILPGGPQRRREVVASFRPVFARSSGLPRAAP